MGGAAGAGVPRGWRRLSLSDLVVWVRPERRPAGPVDGLPDGPADGPAPGTGAGDGSGAGPAAPSSASPRSHAGVPVTLGGVRVRQTDETTCGSTVLLMLVATGDPVLARWLETGELPAGLPPHRVPPEIPPALRPRGAAPASTVPGRLAAAQRHIKRRTSASALGPLTWPGRFGTPPWTAAREARFPGVTYRVVPFADTSPTAAAVLAAVQRATMDGVPVPLYTGGDLGGGVGTAVPRHVVLAVPPPAEQRAAAAAARLLHVYDPASGKVYRVPVGELLRRTAPHPALGGWTHVSAVLLPTRV